MKTAAKAGKLLLVAVAVAAAASFAYYAHALLARYPPVWPDEALFADPAIHLLRDGTMKTELLSGILPGIERHTYWMPPAYFLSLAAVFRIAGAGFVPMRLFSLAAALAAMGLVYGVSHHSGLDKWISLVPVSLLAVDSVFLRSALVGRMDMLALVLVLLTLYLFIGSSRPPAVTQPMAAREFATGFVAALAFLTHPIGVVAPASALGTRILECLQPRGHRSPRWAPLLAGLVTPLLWAAYILEEPRSFAAQFGAQLMRKQIRYAADAHAFRTALALGQAQYAVSHDLVFVVWVCGMIGLVIASEHRRELAVLPLCQVLLFILVLWSNELWYPVYLAPLTAVGLGHMIGLFKRRTWFIVPSLLTVALCSWFARANLSRLSTIDSTENPVNKTNYATWCAEISRQLPAGSRVLLSIVPDPYFELAKRPDLVLREFAPEGLPIDPRSYAAYMASADYVVVGRPSPSVAVRQFVEAKGQLVSTVGNSAAEGLDASIYKVAR